MIRDKLYYINKIALLKERDPVVNRAIIAKCYRALRRLDTEVENFEESDTTSSNS